MVSSLKATFNYDKIDTNANLISNTNNSKNITTSESGTVLNSDKKHR